MSEDTPTPVKDAGQPSALHEQKQCQQLRQQQQQQAVAAVTVAPMQQHDQHRLAPAAHPRHAGQHNLPQMQPSARDCDRPVTGLILGPYGPAPAATRSAAAAGTAAASRQSTLGISAQPAAGQLALPSAYSRLSIAGDTMADAQRQHDQCAGPAAAGAAVAAWAGHRGNNAVRPDVDVAKLRAQVDQHLQVQPLSVEPVLPPNLKRLRTSSVDKLKQSGAPGEDLSTFIPTPTWGSPRVAELQPAAVGGGKPSCSKKLGTGLAARAAHAAGLLAQAAANSAARSSSLALADVLEPEQQQQQQPEDGAGTSMALDGEAAADVDDGGGAEAGAGVEADTAMDITAATGMPGVDAGGGAEMPAVSPVGLQPVGAAAGALEELPGLSSMMAMGQQLERRPSGQLSALLPQRRSDDELAVQYRLELQQLKAEHAALQMLTQHTEQETRPPVMGHEPVLPTPGVPRSLESEAERLAARVLKQSGGDWQASMSAMMELLRSNMQQGSQLLRGCNKAAHTAAAEGPDQAADHTSSMGMDLDAAAAAATATPAAAAAATATPATVATDAAAGAAGGRSCFGTLAEAAPAVSPCLQLETQTGGEGRHAQAQEQQQQQEQQQLAEAGVDANDAQPQRRRRQRWFPCLDQGDSASQSSCHPDGAAAAAGAAFTSEGPYSQQAAAWPDMQLAAHPAADLGGTADTAMAMDASGAAVVAAAALFSDLVPAAGSRHGSPMRSAAVDSGYHSPAVSSAAGPSPFSAGCGSAAGPSAAGNGFRSRTLTRRQSRLAPKPQAAAAAAADMGMALGLAAVDAAAFDAAAAAATAAAAVTAEPELQDVAAAADAGGHAAHVGVTRSRARKSPPATTPQPQQPPVESCIDDDDDPISRHLMQSAQAVAAAAGAADAGALQMHQQAVGAVLPGSLPGPLNCPDATGGQVLTCSAAAAAAAFAAGATWAPHWEPQQAPQQPAAHGAPRGGHRGLTVNTDCGPLDDESWICAGLLDTPGPVTGAAAAGCAGAAAGQHGPAGTHLPPGATPPMGSAPGADGDAGTGPGKGHDQQQQMLQQQMQYHMQYELCAMQQMQTQMQMVPEGMVAGSYWHPIGTAAMDQGQTGPTHASTTAGAAVGIGPGSVAAAGGYAAASWQQVQGPAMAEAGVGTCKVQVASEDAFPAYMAPAHMQDHHQMQQLQMQPQHHQQQHVIYHQQVPMSQQMAVPQQHMMHGGVPAAGAAAGAGHAAPAAPVVADQALLNMLLGWTNDT